MSSLSTATTTSDSDDSLLPAVSAATAADRDDDGDDDGDDDVTELGILSTLPRSLEHLQQMTDDEQSEVEHVISPRNKLSRRRAEPMSQSARRLCIQKNSVTMAYLFL